MTFRLLKAWKSTRPTISPVLTELGLHPGQEFLLSQLWRGDGVSQAELTTRLGVEPPTVSKALHRLERAGYVRRIRGRGPARTVFLTPAGRDLQGPVEKAWRDADAELLSGLDADERAIFADLAAKVARLN